MTTTPKSTILALLEDLRTNAPGAIDRVASLLVQQEAALSRVAGDLAEAATSLQAIVETYQGEKSVSAPVVTQWAQKAMDAAIACERMMLASPSVTPWVGMDLSDRTNPCATPLLMRIVWFDDPNKVRYCVGTFDEFGTTVDGSRLAYEWNVTHYAAITGVLPGAQPGADWAAGRAAGMTEAATIVREGREVTDPLDDHRSTTVEDFDNGDDAADAIIAAI